MEKLMRSDPQKKPDSGSQLFSKPRYSAHSSALRFLKCRSDVFLLAVVK